MTTHLASSILCCIPRLSQERDQTRTASPIKPGRIPFILPRTGRSKIDLVSVLLALSATAGRHNNVPGDDLNMGIPERAEGHDSRVVGFLQRRVGPHGSHKRTNVAELGESLQEPAVWSRHVLPHFL